jgi:hypothetical protein
VTCEHRFERSHSRRRQRHPYKYKRGDGRLIDSDVIITHGRDNHRRRLLARCLHPRSGAACSAKRSTTTTAHSLIRASGNLGGFQGGIDLLRGSLVAGHYERAALYGAYGDVSAGVTGLVTNPAATAYILTHTGSINLESPRPSEMH